MEFEKLKKIIADVYQIIMGIEEEFDIEIPAESAEQVTTVEEAVEMIKNAVN